MTRSYAVMLLVEQKKMKFYPHTQTARLRLTEKMPYLLIYHRHLGIQEHPMHAEEYPENTRNRWRCMTRSGLRGDGRAMWNSIQTLRKFVFLLKTTSLIYSLDRMQTNEHPRIQKKNPRRQETGEDVWPVVRGDFAVRAKCEILPRHSKRAAFS